MLIVIHNSRLQSVCQLCNQETQWSKDGIVEHVREHVKMLRYVARTACRLWYLITFHIGISPSTYIRTLRQESSTQYVKCKSLVGAALLVMG